MLRSPYSRPEFNPYGDDSSEPEVTGPWNAPSTAGPLDATLSLPGSKSLTNRELVLSALASEPSTLRAPLHSRDTNLMVEALRSLGATIVEQPGESPFGGDWVVTPGELTGSTTVDCGLAGTVMRFLPPVAALALGPTTFDGDAAARKRPMNVTVTSLRDLGVDARPVDLLEHRPRDLALAEARDVYTLSNVLVCVVKAWLEFGRGYLDG
jgi:3-phosphoshikimate 1-carboxyvinyltransferase